MRTTLSRGGPAAAAAAVALLALAAPSGADAAGAGPYQVRRLVSDQAGVAEHQDKDLVNSWGLTFGPGGDVWVADNGTGLSTLYDGDGTKSRLVVTIPQGAPTGTIFNSTGALRVGSGRKSGPAVFLFASEAGIISGWQPAADPTHALVGYAAKDGAIYKGIAVSGHGGTARLYATDFHNGKVDVLDGGFRPVKVGGFTDADIPEGYAPFGIRELRGRLFVTFAKQDQAREDDVRGAGLGFVDVFGADGKLLRRLVSRGALDAPWGLAIAPKDFGPLSGDLLVGNFGDGRINAYDPASGRPLGRLTSGGAPVVIDGLWGLSFGNGQADQPLRTLFFTSGPGDEKHGLYGRIDVTAKP